MTKALVIEDSALMRRQIKRILSDAGFDVSMARNGVEALEMVALIDPDVITLDINMPEMDGLTFLSRLMVERPKPVVMISSLTERGALATFEALEMGAVDFVHKPGGTVTHDIARIEQEIVDKVRAACRSRLSRARGLRQRMRMEREGGRSPSPAPVVAAKPAFASSLVKPVGSPDTPPSVVVIGVSTGGPGTLEEILTRLPADFPRAILVAQHMPAGFTGVFARRLDDACAIAVREVSQPMPIEPGTVYIGRGDADFVVTKRGRTLMATAVPASAEWFWHPSVNHLVYSTMKYLPPEQVIGVLLTGMGNDGAEAMTALRKAGGRTIAESEESAVVFGMPQELIKLGGAEVVLPADQVAAKLIEWVSRASRRQRLG